MAMALSSSSSSSSSAPFRSTPLSSTSHHQPLLHLPLPAFPSATRIRARPPRRTPNHIPEAVVVFPDPRSWREIRSSDVGREYETDDDDEEEEEDRSLDLLVQFLHNVFRKVSRRARRAARSVLPIALPTRLVGFSVNGVLILAFLWILKAFLEVVCTFGSMVFVSILLVRGIWSAVSYIQENRFNQGNRFNDDNSAWNGVQAAT